MRATAHLGPAQADSDESGSDPEFRAIQAQWWDIYLEDLAVQRQGHIDREGHEAEQALQFLQQTSGPQPGRCPRGHQMVRTWKTHLV